MKCIYKVRYWHIASRHRHSCFGRKSKETIHL